MAVVWMHSYRSSRPGSMRRSALSSTAYGQVPAAMGGTRSYSDSYYPAGVDFRDSGHAEAAISQLQDPTSDGREWYDFSASCTLASQTLATDHTYENVPLLVPLTVTQSSGYSSPEGGSLSTTSDGVHHHTAAADYRHRGETHVRRASEPVALGRHATLNLNAHYSSSGSNDESTLTAEAQPTVSGPYTNEVFPEVAARRSPASTEPAASLVYRQREASVLESDRSPTEDWVDTGLVSAASPLQEEVLDYLMPQLMQYMNALALLPYLQRHNLVSEEDIDYICSPLRTDLERRQRIITRAPYRDPEAFDRFLQCLAEEPKHTGHKYLTRRLKEAVQRKRQSPFKRLSSIRMTSPPSLNSSSRWHFSQRTHEHVQQPLPATPYSSASLDRSMVKRKKELTRPTSSGGTRLRRQHSESAADRRSTFPRSSERGVCAWPLEDREPSTPVRLSLPRSYSQSESLGEKEQHLQLPQRKQGSFIPTVYSSTNDEQLTRKKLQWLQERVQIKDCHEPVVFTSKTHYGEDRQLLYSGTLAHHGKLRFVVLFNDMLLVLKGKRSHSQGKLSGVLSQSQSSQLDWFADQTFTTTEPYLLHLLTVQIQRRKTYVCLNYKHHSEVREIVLQACSEEAKKVWEEQLVDAITQCTATHAGTVLHVGTRIPFDDCSNLSCLAMRPQLQRGGGAQQIHSESRSRHMPGKSSSGMSKRQSGRPYTKLTVKMLWIEFTKDYKSLPLYCTVKVCDKKCRTSRFTTESVSNWSFTCEFTDLAETCDFTLFVELYRENTFQPDECLGSAGVQISPGQQSRQVMRGQLQLEDIRGTTVARIAVHNEIGWETKM